MSDNMFSKFMTILVLVAISAYGVSLFRTANAEPELVRINYVGPDGVVLGRTKEAFHEYLKAYLYSDAAAIKRLDTADEIMFLPPGTRIDSAKDIMNGHYEINVAGEKGFVIARDLRSTTQLLNR